MSETVTATLPLKRWPKDGQSDRGTYHLVEFSGDAAEALTAHSVMERLEFGRRRGFGSLKVTARIGETEWRTSVFPQKSNTPSNSKATGQDNREQSRSWVLLIGKKVKKAESLSVDQNVEVAVTL